MTSAPTVGVIGLGEIGGRVTRRLLAAGHPVVVFDVRADAVAAAEAVGAAAADSAAAVGDRADVCLLSLPSPDIVRAVATGSEGVLDGDAIRTCVDLSTTGPNVSREIADALTAAGVAFLDAPVSGGAAGAEQGRLTVMAAGDAATFKAVSPILAAFAREIFHVGSQPGLGQLAKLLNNLLSATALATTAEVMALGMCHGLDAEMLLDVFNASSGRNTATADKFPAAVLSRRFEVGFALALMNKDVQMCLAQARDAGLELPVATAVAARWAAAAAVNRPGADCTEIVRLVEAETATTIAGRGAPDA